MLEHSNNLDWKNETLIYLSCNIEQMIYRLDREDITLFREPDLNNQITAIAVLGNEQNQKVFKKLKLLK
jgi:hypothetical protein